VHEHVHKLHNIEQVTCTTRVRGRGIHYHDLLFPRVDVLVNVGDNRRWYFLSAIQ
jgi:hypothetical protein